MHARALGHFGSMDLLDDGKLVRWRLTPWAGLDLMAAYALETDANRAGVTPRVEVVPGLQSLPRIEFGADSAQLDATAKARLDAIAWAALRWQAGAVSLRGYAGGDPALAKARADAVSAALRARGVDVANSGVADVAATRELVRSAGANAGRSVTLQLAGTAVAM